MEIGYIKKCIESEENDEMRDVYERIQDQYEEKLWHNVTDTIERNIELFTSSSSLGAVALPDLYRFFLCSFQSKLNKLRLSKIVVKAASFLDSFAHSIDFIESFNEFLFSSLAKSGSSVLGIGSGSIVGGGGGVGDSSSSDRQAAMLCTSSLACYYLLSNNLDKGISLLDSISLARDMDPTISNHPPSSGDSSAVDYSLLVKSRGVFDYLDPEICSLHHYGLALYHKAKDHPSLFYTNALLFLAYSPVPPIDAARVSPMEHGDFYRLVPPDLSLVSQFAFDMGISALVSRDICNYGELLAHPSLQYLAQDTERSWLCDLLTTVNQGDVQGFESKFCDNSTVLSIPILSDPANWKLVQEKICVLGLMDLIFHQKAGQLTVSFAEIGQRTGLNQEGIEPLLMRSMSLGLVKGSIDEVNGAFHVEWVKPRVLSGDQMKTLQNKMGGWREEVVDLLTFARNTTAPELLA